jgi:hypothetical protein
MRMVFVLALAVAPVARVAAQHEEHAHGAAAAMGGSGAHALHMRWTPKRGLNRADSLRAMAIADTLRRAIAQYADTAAAVRDGYRKFAPGAQGQRVYHYSRTGNGIAAGLRWDATAPTSLLYERGADGRVRLTGAMYTAPARLTAAELDERIPLGAVQWHQHVNLCIPLGDDARMAAVRAGTDPEFGLTGSIADAATCRAKGGRFVPRVFGWMAHVEVFKGAGVSDVFETEASHGAAVAGKGHKH